MKCSEISELLPWLVSERLTAEERRRVERHLKDCDRCRADLEATVVTLRAADAHIPGPALVAFVASGSWPEPDGPVFSDHLAHCAECRTEADRARASFRLLDSEPKHPWLVNSRWRSLALAASIAGLIAVSGWSWTWWVLSTERNSLRASLRNLEQRPESHPVAQDKDLPAGVPGGPGFPRIDLQVVELLPDDLVLRGSSIEAITAVDDASTRATVLLLLTNDVTDYEDHRVELRDSQDRVYWQVEGVHRQAGGGFSLLLPPGSLPADPVTILLSGKRQGRWTVMGTYRVRARSSLD